MHRSVSKRALLKVKFCLQIGDAQVVTTSAVHGPCTCARTTLCRHANNVNLIIGHYIMVVGNERKATFRWLQIHIRLLSDWRSVIVICKGLWPSYRQVVVLKPAASL